MISYDIGRRYFVQFVITKSRIRKYGTTSIPLIKRKKNGRKGDTEIVPLIVLAVRSYISKATGPGPRAGFNVSSSLCSTPSSIKSGTRPFACQPRPYSLSPPFLFQPRHNAARGKNY